MKIWIQTAPPNKWLVFTLTAVGIFMSTLDSSIVNIALPAIMQDLGASLAVTEWVVMIYLLTVSSLLLCFGRLSDIKGRRWVHSRGLFIFTLGSLFCGLSNAVHMLIISRCFQGLGSAMVMACSPALVSDAFPKSERGKALGLVGAVVASGLSVGPALGGFILHIASWQYIFYLNLPIGFLAAAGSATLLKGGKADETRPETFDWAGAALMAACLATFLTAVTHAHEWGYASPKSLAFFASALIFGILAAWVETRVSHPLFEPGLLRIRIFTLPALSAMILFLSLFTIVFLMPFFLMYPCGFSENHAGYILVTLFIFLFAVSPVSGAISDRIGSRLLCTIGMSVLTAALFFLSRLQPTDDPYQIIWRLAMAGVGTAIFIAPNSSTVMSAVPPAYMGVAAGTVATARNLGMVLGVAFAGAVFNSIFFRLSGGLDLKDYGPQLKPVFMDAFRMAMLAGAVISGLGAAVSFLRGKEAR